MSNIRLYKVLASLTRSPFYIFFLKFENNEYFSNMLFSFFLFNFSSVIKGTTKHKNIKNLHLDLQYQNSFIPEDKSISLKKKKEIKTIIAFFQFSKQMMDDL